MNIKQLQTPSQHYSEDGVMSLDEHALYLSQSKEVKLTIKSQQRTVNTKQRAIFTIKPISIVCTINDSECALPIGVD